MGYISLETLDLPIKVYTSTRQDGFSSIPYDNFNLSYDVGDNPNNVLLNRNKLCEDLKIQPYNLIIPKQKHSDKILKITSVTDDREADCLYTLNKDLTLSDFKFFTVDPAASPLIDLYINVELNI